MPAESEKQRKAAAIALHNPGKLFKKNREMLKMSKSELKDYARKPGNKSASSNPGKALKNRKGY